jgi:hypothetical protein
MAEEARGATKSIAGYWVDALATGGASIVLAVALLMSSDWGADIASQRVDPRKLLLLQVLVNAPHFAASYFLLYGGQPRRHPWSAFYMPALLVAYCVFALTQASATSRWVDGLSIVAGVYLAWHYTGQAWGMMAVFSNLDGVPFASRERFAIRAGLRLLLAFHVVWYCRFVNNDFLQETIGRAYPLAIGAFALSIPLGLFGLITCARRTNRALSLRTVLPWLAIHLWYLLMMRWPKAIFWAQISHATQYLIFPARVEVNRHVERARGLGRVPRPVLHMIVWTFVLALAGVLIADGGVLPAALRAVFAPVLSDKAASAIPSLIFSFINIHHYFTDGAVWKLSDPTTRKELTAHLARSPT